MSKVTLQTPIERKDGPVTEVVVTRPGVGQLRGLAMTDIVRMDVNALVKLLPRVTQPPLLPDEVAALDPADFMELGGALVGFFMSQASLKALQSDMAG